MTTSDTLLVEDKYRQNDRLKLFGATALTYGFGLYVVSCNNYFVNQLGHAPIEIKVPFLANNLFFTTLLDIIGKTPLSCLTRIAIVALIVQAVNYLTMDASAVDMDRYRPYVFWRAIYRFLLSCKPFLKNQDLSGPPTTSLTEYERITIRYFAVKMLFLPMMVGFFYGNLQRLLNLLAMNQARAFTPVYIEHAYLLVFNVLMVADVAWFAFGCCIETQKFSPIKMVDPYASGWLMALACYPPLVSIAGQFCSWGPPEFPEPLNSAPVAMTFAVIGVLLYTIYVIADFSFGIKTGNLTYRGLVDKGPYKWVRHPMYASKNLAWIIFTIPALNFHIQKIQIPNAHHWIYMPNCNLFMIWPMIIWVSIYALRGITEERYLLGFPEYREYCQRVRYRFIPWVI